MEGQTFIELCEKTANVGYVLTQVQREFGSEYAVVTADTQYWMHISHVTVLMY